MQHRHPCIDKPSAVTDIGLQISETFRDLKIEQQLAPTRVALSSALNAGSTNFLKAVDGIKGRWPVQRSSSSNSTRSESSISTGSAVAVGSVPEGINNVADSSSADGSTPTPTPATPTSPPRPPSVIAAQVTSDAKAALGAWGTGIGSFFSSRASRFSLSRTNSSSTPVKEADGPAAQSSEIKADPAAITSPNGKAVTTGDHEGVDPTPGA